MPTFDIWTACGTKYVRANRSVVGTMTKHPVPGSQRQRFTFTFTPRAGVGDKCGLHHDEAGNQVELLARLALTWVDPYTREQAQAAYRALVAQYGLTWGMHTPEAAYIASDLIGTVLEEAGRREALGLPAHNVFPAMP
jgi:hypothetical protein